ncbi:MAG: 7-carboxy-7-deazaguanine synthase QueE, partial [Muribaculaceae bacterium]|nr:7-carboxy-7-deazaguanine synthase QueE [Muribaculaceae bacterium]
MKKINEIFYSLQGEGAHTGCPSVFVRFSGCNKRCSFCDTQHEVGVLMSEEDIIAEINKYPARWIILTGGEPSMWIDSEFVEHLKKATGKLIA